MKGCSVHEYERMGCRDCLAGDIQSKLSAAEAQIERLKDHIRRNDTQSILVEKLQAENKRMREVLQWVVDEYERGERKGYDAKITPEIAKSALSQIAS